eukprot:CAMPEP_0178396966 /NCGR_PEP_ID=MMETSP0689_2-20121128/14002_1 /TAXON_ID=160604 /ORGANISM="Amphidinium massartii, Strain CS-259" /LENGTH=70 /DNA_ID=CAMNT_0020017659 /DNA_START=81 /DNA_END=293 /DNA_ORIENTATION=-
MSSSSVKAPVSPGSHSSPMATTARVLTKQSSSTKRAAILATASLSPLFATTATASTEASRTKMSSSSKCL